MEIELAKEPDQKEYGTMWTDNHLLKNCRGAIS